MNTAINFRLIRKAAACVAAGIALFFLSGCLQEHLVWSPDGSQAAVVSTAGLRFCTPDGKLSAPLMPAVTHVAWLVDSQGLVVARARKTGDWKELSRLMGQERTAAVEAAADSVFAQLEKGSPWGDPILEMDGKKQNGSLLKVALRERHGEALRRRLGPQETEKLESATVEVNGLVLVKVAGEKVEPAAVLHEGLGQIKDIRVSPAGGAVAFTTAMAEADSKESRLLVAGLDGSGASTVAESVAECPDWTADGKALVYVRASLGGGKDDLRIGTVERCAVDRKGGQLRASGEAVPLAGLFYQETTRVRCLQDGRILFNAVEFSLPVTKKDADPERESLFALDPARQSTLVRMVPKSQAKDLPANLGFFEMSPDEQRVLVGGLEGEVAVLTLATGEVSQHQPSGDYGLMAAPVWRGNNEITYVRRNPLVDGKRPIRKGEVVVDRLDSGKDVERVLSRDWSQEVLESIFDSSDRK